MLAELFTTHRGKLCDKWSLYVSTYERLLAGHAAQPWRVLEIGIQNGGSLELWARHFPNATHVIGCDIDPACGRLEFDDPRITVVVGDANSDAVHSTIAALSPRFDFIVDDGSHSSSDIVRTFARYFPMLCDGGLFVAEDLHCSYWSSHEGGLFHPASSMAFFKRLADVVNHEHWGVAQPRSALLASFAHEYGVSFDEDSLAHIHTVEFVNSMCVIRKEVPHANVLGARVIRGTQALVNAAPIAQDGAASRAFDQGGNRWSRLEPLPEQELAALRLRTDEQNERLRQLLQDLHERDEALAGLRAQRQAFDAALAERGKALQTAHARIDQVQEALQTSQAAQQRLGESTRMLQGELDTALGRLHAIESSMAWKLAAPLRSLQHLQANVQRASRRISAAKRHEGGTLRLLGQCLRSGFDGGPSALRRYLKQAEADHDNAGDAQKRP